MGLQKSFLSNIRSNNSTCDAGRFDQKVSVNCEVQGGIWGPCVGDSLSWERAELAHSCGESGDTFPQPEDMVTKVTVVAVNKDHMLPVPTPSSHSRCFTSFPDKPNQ